MLNYILKRLLLIVPTLFGISLVTFFIIQLTPGSPVGQIGGEGGVERGQITKEIIDATKKLYGLDKPLYIQYSIWLKQMVTFNFGYSYKDGRPVWEKIRERIPITLSLSILSIMIAYIVSIPLGIFSAIKQYTKADKIITIILFVLYSMPNFWVAMMLIMFLGGGDYLNLFPIFGISSEGAESFGPVKWLLDRIWHLVLPVTCLTYESFASLSRYQRSSMLEVIRQDFIRTARAKGLSEQIVVFKHAFRNSLIPIVTLLGYILPALLGGSVIIESIFSIPGLGKLGFESVLNRDYPVIMAISVISAFLTLFGMLLSDILYVIVDPRISL